MEALKTFRLKYSQPRLSHTDGDAVIWEKKEHVIEARNLQETERFATLFLEQRWLKVSEAESYGPKQTSVEEFLVPKESTQMLESFRRSLVDDAL